MKKITYLLAAFVLVFTTACDPMEDVYEEIGNTEKVITGEIEYELTDEDYDDLDLSYGNFSSVDDAKEIIPGFLTDKFPVWGEGSLANVTFKLYAPKRTERSLEVYKVTSDDYDAQGGNVARYGNFSSMNDIVSFLDFKYPDPANRLLVSLTYKYYSGGVKTLNNGFIFVDGEWNFLQGFTSDEYEAMEQSYPNFSSKDQAETYIPLFLNDYFKFSPKEAGEIVGFMYNVYQTDYDDIDGDGSTSDRTTYSYAIYYITDGANWVEYENVLNQTIQFGHDGNVWVPDNTINYTLTQADYDLVGNGYYGNFDVRAGKDEETVEARLAKINTILKNNFPGMEEGQKFNVTYNVYSGAAEVWSMKVILVGADYVLQ